MRGARASREYHPHRDGLPVCPRDQADRPWWPPMNINPADDSIAQSPVADNGEAQEQYTTPHKPSTKPSIIGSYADVLEALTPQRRRGLVAQLAVGFYDGWRPGRAEVADIVAVAGIPVIVRELPQFLDATRQRPRYQRRNGVPGLGSPRGAGSRGLHCSVPKVPRMPGQCLGEQVRGVLTAATGRRAVEIVLQRVTVVRVRTVIDDLLGTTARW